MSMYPFYTFFSIPIADLWFNFLKLKYFRDTERKCTLRVKKQRKIKNQKKGWKNLVLNLFERTFLAYRTELNLLKRKKFERGFNY